MRDSGRHHRDVREAAPGINPPWAVKKVFAQIEKDDVLGLAAELAFQFFLALFPFLIFLGAIGSIVAPLLGMRNPADLMVGLLGSSLPPGASDTVRAVVSDTLSKGNNNLLSFTVLGAIWAATVGTDTLIKAMNRAYDVAETRPLWRRFLLALGLTLVAAPMLLLAFLALVVVQAYGTAIANALGVGDKFQMAIDILRWPVVAVLVAAVAAMLYRLGPNLPMPSRWRTPGAVLFAVGWLVATHLFGIYVSNFSSYSSIYGVLGGVAVLMIWFYITAFVLLLGAEVNAVIEMAEAPARAKGERRQKEREAEQQRAA